MCTIKNNQMMYGSWVTEHNRQNFSSFWTIFYHLPPKTQKIKIKKKTKKMHGHIIILHKCTKNQDHMLHTVPEIWHVMDVIVIFHFRLFFVLLPPNSPKNENFKKMKKRLGDVIILHKCAKNHDHMQYCSWDMVCNGCNCYFSF